jgi:hypothetical protein
MQATVEEMLEVVFSVSPWGVYSWKLRDKTPLAEAWDTEDPSAFA